MTIDRPKIVLHHFSDHAHCSDCLFTSKDLYKGYRSSKNVDAGSPSRPESVDSTYNRCRVRATLIFLFVEIVLPSVLSRPSGLADSTARFRSTSTRRNDHHPLYRRQSCSAMFSTMIRSYLSMSTLTSINQPCLVCDWIVPQGRAEV
jgi:hypothetical protein